VPVKRPWVSGVIDRIERDVGLIREFDMTIRVKILISEVRLMRSKCGVVLPNVLFLLLLLLLITVLVWVGCLLLALHLLPQLFIKSGNLLLIKRY
jgi:hypothetical protein